MFISSPEVGIINLYVVANRTLAKQSPSSEEIASSAGSRYSLDRHSAYSTGASSQRHSIPSLRIPADILLHMRTPVFLGMRAAVKMPFMSQAKLVELSFHTLRHFQFRVVVPNIHKDVRTGGGRNISQPSSDF